MVTQLSPSGSRNANPGALPPNPPRPPTSAQTQAAGLKVTRDHAGLTKALAGLGIEVRENIRAARVEYRRTGPVHGKLGELPANLWTAATDAFDSAIRQTIGARYLWATGQPARFGAASYTDIVLSIALQRRVDPFKQWLEDLPAWDGVARLDRLFIDVLDCQDDEFTKAAALVLIGVVARTYDPGAQHDWMPVLAGRQGCGKSTAVREMVPDVRGWFVEGLDLSASTKELTERGLGSVVIEFSELAGIRRSEVERLKSFISMRTARVRLSYLRHAEDYPRQWVGVGTVNESGAGFLPLDRTGYRRFLVLKVGQGANPDAVRRYFAANRLQVWAEALHRYHAGESSRLPDDVEKASSLRNRDFAVADDSVENAVAQAASLVDAHLGTTISRVMVETGLALDDIAASRDRGAQLRLASALREGGWIQRRVLKQRRWFPPA